VSSDVRAAGPSEPTTVGALVRELAAILGSAGVADAGREANEIIAAMKDAPRFWPTVNAHVVMTADEHRFALQAAARRAAGAPFAYAVGSAAFRKLTLSVDDRVLIPRPETELIVDLVIQLTDTWPGGTALDIGTGSGAIALALASEGTFTRVLGGDISSDAIVVARGNAERLAPEHRDRLDFRVGSLFAPFAGEQARVVVSNPPYIAGFEAAELPAAVRSWEPAVALFGGHDGMGVIRQLVRDARQVLEPEGWLVMEVDSRRASEVVEAISMYDSYADIGVRLDLAGRERFVIARLSNKRDE
jgi:release factor glutamine methyltransferase